ncbi:virion structural protein [Betalipothrixvirus uzonense]|uniref:Viral structural protein n=1 Tax=Betalipothrixvirus uzonense TaxID=512792 RepID=B2CRL3_9VIRU|nr:virion structural protein [Acidianus filamentous virus 9]ACB37270.1 viral structural protein [Acidianus filamentous virus 9]
METYELAKTVYDKYLTSNKRYVCLNGFEYGFEDEYLKKYELCTDSFDVILAYFKIYDPKTEFVPVLLARLGLAGASSIYLNPPFSLYNNAVYIWVGRELFYHEEANVVKTRTGYNDNSEPLIRVNIKWDMNPMSIEAIGWCLSLAFRYNKPVNCGVYGVLFE